MLIETIILILIVIYVAHKYMSRNYDYWEKRNIPYVKPKPFVGNLQDVVLRKCDVGQQLESLYEKCDSPYFGIFLFSQPALIVKDPEILRCILIKDFDCFVDRITYFSEKDAATSHMLFVDKGASWKTMRNKISPFFSPNKLRNMFNSVDNIAIAMQKYIEKHQDEPNLEAKEIFCKFSTDVIAKCAFAIDANSFDKDGEFRDVGRKIFDDRFITSVRYLCHFFFHPVAKILDLKLFDPEVTNFLRDVFWESIKIREEQNAEGHDLLDIIVELRKDKEFCKSFKFEGDKVISQAFMFFAAGFETVASTIAFATYELCINPEVQNKLRENMREVLKKHGKLSYDCLAEMDYLNLVIKETLRKYPALPFLDRVCNTDYKIPGTDDVIEKGTPVLVAMLGLHNDPKIYDQPDVFIPERFEKNRRDCSYLSFGKGPRGCVGERMGLLTTRLAIFRIFSEFDVLKTEETPIPLVFYPGTIIPFSECGLPMKFKKREPLL